MSLEADITKLLKSEGYKVTEAIKSALEDFIDICENEFEDMADAEDDEDDDFNDDD